MARRIARDPIDSGRRFSAETIETCVRWYITYRLSYRDLVAIMAEQGVVVSHTTIMRWVLRYVPEYERRWSRYARSRGSSWRMDETAVSVRGGRHYLYRAVDQAGKSAASLFCSDRSMEAAQAFFRTAVGQDGVPWPEKINVDGNSATYRGLRLLAAEDKRWRNVEVRARRYLNNVVEQDHRAIKQRCADAGSQGPSLGTHPDVPTTLAQARHRAPPRLLAAGIDPSVRRRELRLLNDDGCAAAPELPGIWRQAG